MNKSICLSIPTRLILSGDAVALVAASAVAVVAAVAVALSIDVSHFQQIVSKSEENEK